MVASRKYCIERSCPSSTHLSHPHYELVLELDLTLLSMGHIGGCWLGEMYSKYTYVGRGLWLRSLNMMVVGLHLTALLLLLLRTFLNFLAMMMSESNLLFPFLYCVVQYLLHI